MSMNTKDADFEYLSYGPADGVVTSLVVLLHGYGRNATTMQKMAEEIRAVLPGSMVVCPHGPQEMNNGVMAGKNNDLHIPQDALVAQGSGDLGLRRQWFQIDGAKQDFFPRLEEVARNLNLFIDAQRDMFGLSDRNVVLMGFSQGGGTALYTAYTRCTELAGLICHSAPVLEKDGGDSNLKARPKTLFIYGTDDPEFSQDSYAHSFNWVQSYIGGQGNKEIVPGLAHYTSTQSRKICADYIRAVLGA